MLAEWPICQFCRNPFVHLPLSFNRFAWALRPPRPSRWSFQLVKPSIGQLASLSLAMEWGQMRSGALRREVLRFLWCQSNCKAQLTQGYGFVRKTLARCYIEPGYTRILFRCPSDTAVCFWENAWHGEVVLTITSLNHNVCALADGSPSEEARSIPEGVCVQLRGDSEGGLRWKCLGTSVGATFAEDESRNLPHWYQWAHLFFSVLFVMKPLRWNFKHWQLREKRGGPKGGYGEEPGLESHIMQSVFRHPRAQQCLRILLTKPGRLLRTASLHTCHCWTLLLSCWMLGSVSFIKFYISLLWLASSLCDFAGFAAVGASIEHLPWYLLWRQSLKQLDLT